MRTGWKVCPHCGACSVKTTPVRPESFAGGELSPPEAYTLFCRTRHALLAPFEQIFEELLAAGDKSKIALQSVRASRLEHALQSGVDGMARELPSSNKAARSARADPELASVRAVCADWMEAKSVIEEEKIPEGFLEHVVYSFTNESVQGKAALGATLGSIVPGVGTMLGGAVGAFFGGQESGKRHAALFERFHETINRLRAALIEVHPRLLERLASDRALALRRSPAEAYAGIIELDDAVAMIDAELERETPSFAACEQRARSCIRVLPEESGCHALLGAVLQAAGQPETAITAVRVAVETNPKELAHWTQMVPVLVEADRVDEACSWLSKIAEYWPDNPDAHRSLAEGYLSAGRADIAHLWAELALAAAKDDIALVLLSARAEAHLNHLERAAELLIRIASSALASIKHWRITLTEREIASAARTAPAAGLLSQPLNHARLAMLCLDRLARTDAYLGSRAPAVKIAGARKTFLVGVPGSEAVLWYYDSTFFGSGSEGIALTHARIVWKGLMEEPAGVLFADLEDVEISNEASLVLRSSAGIKTCVCGDREMTEAVFRFLTITRAVQSI